jgi:phosphate transport system substrate-binding protein
MKRFLLIGLFGLLALVSCKKKEAVDTLSTGYIQVACDESLKNLMDAELDVFAAHNAYSYIDPIYSNETDIIRLLVEDSVRFALVTRDLNVKERSELEKKQMVARKFLVAFDGVALITNKENRDSIIGAPTIKKILTGEITEWKQIYPDSPLGTIRVIFDNPQSGVLRYALDSISMGVSLSPNVYALNNSLEVIDRVAQLPNALGLVGFNQIGDETNSKARELRSKIRVMWISKEEKATLDNSSPPYAGELRQENYPYWRPVYVLLSDPRSGLSSGLSIFFSQQIGQMIILRCGLLPVTDPQNRDALFNYEYPE